MSYTIKNTSRLYQEIRTGVVSRMILVLKTFGIMLDCLWENKLSVTGELFGKIKYQL